ncbi:haloalkane dehalogenase [Streptomyces longispororuber]|uniref:Haloalkane dehalogenase n=1 Tax=Streptomyces longispororuber TaxID=68230 RepID=A0A919DFQ4_9ACTN|nr:alpha/beta fold hydrolase [Streptomyces longispororuber]GHE43704.1 haloalkane dehalogenase [Streptomyces longispororuber]
MKREDMSAAGYSFRSHWFRHEDGTSQHYLDEGSGEPLLFLHGNPTWSYCWRRLIHALRTRYRCVAPDHVGMGLSARPDERHHPYSAVRHLTDLQDLLAHLVRDRGMPGRGWTLVAHDWGGVIGMALARRDPGLVRRLVLLNTAAFPWPGGYRLPLALRLIRDHPWAARVAHASNAFVHGAARWGVTQPLPDEVRRAYTAPYRGAAQRLAVIRFVQDIPMKQGDPAWPLVDGTAEDDAVLAAMPAFIGWGERDPVFNDVILAEWRRRLPLARVHRYPQAGHYVMEDAHHELLPALEAFLGSTAPGPPSGLSAVQAARTGKQPTSPTSPPPRADHKP